MNEQVRCEFLTFLQKGRAGGKFPHHMGVLKIFGTLDYAHGNFSEFFFMGFSSDWPYERAYKI